MDAQAGEALQGWLQGLDSAVAALGDALPWLLAALVLLALLLAVAAWRSLGRPRRAEAARPPPPPAPAPTPADGAAAVDTAALRGSFARALARLRERIPGRGFRYRVPWFLMVGEEGGGASAALAGCGLEPALAAEAGSGSAPCRWWFFDGGIVLAVAEAVISAPAPGRLRASPWRQLLRLLQRHRPRRPLDGVVVAIPAAALTRDDPEALRRRARQLCARLWELQRVLGMRLPVYVLITRAQGLAGFDALTRELPARLRGQMLGWSSPYSLDSAYARSWVEEAFLALDSDILCVQAELMAARPALGDADGLFALPSSVSALAGPLADYLDELFRPTAYHEGFFFRGVYLAGEVAPGGEPGPGTPGRGRPQAFLRELLAAKVFPEHTLARPLGGALVARDRRVLAIQVAVVVVALAGILGLWRNYREVVDNARDLPAVLARIEATREALHRWESVDPAARSGGGACTQAQATPAGSPPPALGQTTLGLLEELATIETRFYERPFIPSSYRWFSDLRHQVRAALLHGYVDVGLRTVCWELAWRGRELARPALDLLGGGVPAAAGPAFARLADFVARFTALEAAVVTYNAMHRSWREGHALRADDGVHGFVELVSYALGEPGNPEPLAAMAAQWMEQRLRQHRPPPDFRSRFRSLDLDELRSAAAANLLVLAGAGGGRPDAEEAVRLWEATGRFLDAYQGRIGEAGPPAPGAHGALLEAVPEGRRLVWDLPALGRSLDLIERFEVFLRSEAVTGLPGALRRSLEGLAREQFEGTLASSLAAAQALEEKNQRFSVLHDEAELRSDSANLDAASELLIQLGGAMERLGLTDTWVRFTRLVARDTVDHLREVDRLLGTERLYEPVRDLAGWDGSPGLGFYLYGLADATDLGAYLIMQRERISLLAGEYARPALGYLNRVGHGPDPTLFRWQRIVMDLQAYRSGVPGNPVAVLEQFLLTELNQVGSGECQALPDDTGGNAGDFFLARRNRLLGQVRQRCQGVVEDRFSRAYEPLARAFNRSLAGRFPFAGPDSATAAGPDASPAALREVYALYEALPAAVREALGAGERPPGVPGAVAAFLERLQAAGLLLAPWVEAEADAPLPAVAFRVAFRVLPEAELGGDQIIEWTLTAGERPALYRGGPGNEGVWRYGEAVTLGLRWAEGSAVRPVPDPVRPDLRVVGDTATFAYPGGWGLLRAMVANRAGRSAAGAGTTLALEVPVQPREGATAAPERARVHVRVTLLGAGPADGEPRPLGLPAFPRRAP